MAVFTGNWESAASCVHPGWGGFLARGYCSMQVVPRPGWPWLPEQGYRRREQKTVDLKRALQSLIPYLTHCSATIGHFSLCAGQAQIWTALRNSYRPCTRSSLPFDSRSVPIFGRPFLQQFKQRSSGDVKAGVEGFLVSLCSHSLHSVVYDV